MVVVKLKPVVVEVDEQGSPWPPPLALAGFVVAFGGQASSLMNGLLVNLGPYLVEYGVFEAYAVVGCVPFVVGDVIFLKPEEISPINDASAEYLRLTLEARVDVYSEEVYDLRDLLDGAGIAVTADAVNSWNAEQRQRIGLYATMVGADLVVGPKPGELP